jgi:prokaryotic ubiquitin-like protein Pup
VAEREQIRSKSSDTEAESETDKSFAKVDTSKADDLLDEIDSVLEKNAAEFVKGFVQKGGE